jgi:LPXTG-motif cell wall-anchored protein
METPGTSYLIGSEGTDSPLVRIAFNPATFTTPPPSIDPQVQIEAQHPVKSILWKHQAQLIRAAPFVFGGILLVAAAWWIRRRRRRANPAPN